MNRYDIALGKTPPEDPPGSPDVQLSGRDLDELGNIAGLLRMHRETDEHFRERILTTIRPSVADRAEAALMAHDQSMNFAVTPVFEDNALIRSCIYETLNNYTRNVQPNDQHAGEIGNIINTNLNYLLRIGRLHRMPEITVVFSPGSQFGWGWGITMDGHVMQWP